MSSKVGLSVLVALVVGVGMVGVAVGPVPIELGKWLAGELAWEQRVVVWEIRLPRVIAGVLVGAALGTAGAVIQALFRNPLAEPGLIGVSAGATLGAFLAIFFRLAARSLAGGFPGRFACNGFGVVVGGRARHARFAFGRNSYQRFGRFGYRDFVLSGR